MRGIHSSTVHTRTHDADEPHCGVYQSGQSGQSGQIMVRVPSMPPTMLPLLPMLMATTRGTREKRVVAGRVGQMEQMGQVGHPHSVRLVAYWIWKCRGRRGANRACLLEDELQGLGRDRGRGPAREVEQHEGISPPKQRCPDDRGHCPFGRPARAHRSLRQPGLLCALLVHRVHACLLHATTATEVTRFS